MPRIDAFELPRRELPPIPECAGGFSNIAVARTRILYAVLQVLGANSSSGPSERMGFEFRTEFFNLFNHPQFGAPDTFLPDGTFGSINNTINNPRLIQFALKFVFLSKC